MLTVDASFVLISLRYSPSSPSKGFFVNATKSTGLKVCGSLVEYALCKHRALTVSGNDWKLKAIVSDFVSMLG